MPRYLTPFRIATLILIDLYISDDIPSTTKLPFLLFISSQVVLPFPGLELADEVDENDSSRSGPPKPVNPTDILALKEHLETLRASQHHKNIYDVFLQRVWDVDGIDGLFELFAKVKDLSASASANTSAVVPNSRKVARSSPLGVYVRRCECRSPSSIDTQR